MSLLNANSLTREHTHTVPKNTWQNEYKTSIKKITKLCQALELNIDQLPVCSQSAIQFPLRVPWSYVRRMQKNNPQDPLLLQVLPTSNEQLQIENYVKDPVGDLQNIKSNGLLQKYNGRALVLTTSVCAIHCRYCFRRHFPYSKQNPRHDAWNGMLEEIKNDKTISEIILSGGDPLMLNDAELKDLLHKFESIQHIKRLRIHTRLPVVIPNRINDKLVNLITTTRLKIIVVLHINHAQEINQEFKYKVDQLAVTRCTLLNQSVLLKGVNDHAAYLVELSESLFECRIMPYYLHLLDKVDGAAHFDVPKNEAVTIMQNLSAQLPGYLVPKLVEEIPGMRAKNVIAY